MCDLFDALGADFSSVRQYYSELSTTMWYADGTGVGAAFVIVATWAVATAIPTLLALWLLDRFRFGGP